MTGFLYITTTLIVLAILRFGIPLLITFLIKLGCCRIFHLDT